MDLAATLPDNHPDAHINTKNQLTELTQQQHQQQQQHQKPDPLKPRQKNAIFVHDKRWYFRLIRSADDSDSDDDTQKQKTISARVPKPKQARGLLDDYKLEQLDGKLIVCMMTPKAKTTDGNDLRLYSFFDSYIDFASYQRKFSPERRSFYEVILGGTLQKPHFDIDLNSEELLPIHPDLISTGNLIKDAVITSIIKVFEEKGVILDPIRDILIYTSHNQTKQSYHIIVNNYCHYNNEEAKALYKLVVAKFPEELMPYVKKTIDPKVYSPTQQFRILGSQKIGSGRVKVFAKTFTYQNQTYEHQYIEPAETPEYEMILQLEESLLSSTSSCNILPSFLDPNNLGYNGQNGAYAAKYNTEDVTKDLAARAIQLLASLGGVTPKDKRFPYQFLGIKGGIISLKRLKASKCQLCNRVHENENPYLLVVGEGNNKTIYFHCRRAPAEKKLLIGYLDEKVDGTNGTNDGTTDVANPNMPQLSPPRITNGMTGTTADANRAQIATKWCTTVLERLQTLALQEPEKPTVKLPLYKQEPDPEHIKPMMHNVKTNFKWN